MLSICSRILRNARVNALALGLGVVGDRVLDDHPRLVEYGHALGHSGDELEAGQAKRPGAAHPAAPGAVDQPSGGDHLRQHHRDGLQRLDLDVLVAPRVGMLDGQDADRAFETDDGHAGKAVKPLLARFRPVREGGMLGSFGEVEDAAFGGNGADQPLAHPEAW